MCRKFNTSNGVRYEINSEGEIQSVVTKLCAVRSPRTFVAERINVVFQSYQIYNQEVTKTFNPTLAFKRGAINSERMMVDISSSTLMFAICLAHIEHLKTFRIHDIDQWLRIFHDPKRVIYN